MIFNVDIGVERALMDSEDFVQLTNGGKVYSMLAPPKTPKPYVILDSSLSRSQDLFGGSASLRRNGLAIHLWGKSKRNVMDLYEAVYAALHNKVLPMSGLVSGKLELIAVFLDEDGVSYHGVCNFTTITR